MDKAQIDYAHHAFAWESSKLSQKTYCRDNDINYGKFVAARSKLQASRGLTRPTPKFIEVKPKSDVEKSINDMAPVGSKVISVKFASGSILDIPINLSPEQYNTIFSSLKAVL